MRSFLNPAVVRGALTAVALAAASAAVHAAPIVWTIAGPGTTSASNAGGTSMLGYDNPGLFSSTQVWEVRGVAAEAGDYVFDWDYTGFHSFFRVTAFLNTTEGDTLVSAGPESCCTEPSAGFSYDGRYTFASVAAGDTIGFNLGGNHFDATRAMSGTLTLTRVSAPGSMALAGLGLLALGAATRRRS
jgi:hypothetical protein